MRQGFERRSTGHTHRIAVLTAARARTISAHPIDSPEFEAAFSQWVATSDVAPSWLKEGRYLPPTVTTEYGEAELRFVASLPEDPSRG